MKLMMFSKHLGELSVAEAGRAIRGLGFEGIDLTVRPGGHVLPDKAEAELVPAVRALAGLGLAVPLVTTGVTSAEEPYAVQIFEAAARAGVPELKLGYWRYGEFGTFRETMDRATRALDGLEVLARRTGVRGNIHVHSGDHMSALAPVVWYWIKDRDPAAIGAYVDPGHTVVEGGAAGWRMGLDLLSGRIAVAAVKDYTWHPEERPLGGVRMVRVARPLGQGMVPWPEVFACLRAAGFDGWLSVHREYGLQTAQAAIEDVPRDLGYLRGALGQT